MKRAAFTIPFLLLSICALVGMYIQEVHATRIRSQYTYQDHAHITKTSTTYLYYTLKDTKGFVLARARRGSAGQPLETPRPLSLIGNSFGLSPSDNVLMLQPSPDGEYVAVDGTRGDAEQVWIYAVQQMTIQLQPAAVTGNFLHWLPDGHTFLYRPMFPMGPAALTDGNIWNPGLWKVDAATGSHSNLPIGMPSANLIDATSSPDGSHIIYSTTAGMHTGSDTWIMQSDGSALTHLFKTQGLQSVLALFSWSPDGKQIAYERLADNSTPFLTAGLWVMNAQGEHHQRIADTDGGHGFSLSWSPDSQKIAFIVRTNTSDQRANMLAQSLQCGIAVADMQNLHTQTLAGSEQTGMNMNINPTWSTDSKHITFTAQNAANRIVGGTPRYWSVAITSKQTGLALKLPGPALQHVVAVG